MRLLLAWLKRCFEGPPKPVRLHQWCRFVLVRDKTTGNCSIERLYSQRCIVCGERRSNGERRQSPSCPGPG